MIGTDTVVSKMAATTASETLTPPDDSSSDGSEIDFSTSSRDPESLQVTNAESSPSSRKKSSLVAQKETALVARSKLLVYIFLVALAVVVGTVAYVFISREEEEDLEVKVRLLKVPLRVCLSALDANKTVCILSSSIFLRRSSVNRRTELKACSVLCIV